MADEAKTPWPATPWLTIPQGAAYIQKAPQEFREMVYGGVIPSYRRSERRVFVDARELDEYMRSLPSAARVPPELRAARGRA